jgi:hypothetical protein
VLIDGEEVISDFSEIISYLEENYAAVKPEETPVCSARSSPRLFPILFPSRSAKLSNPCNKPYKEQA